ncbi:MAG: glycosyltransferase family 9 protein [Candidatus Hydrogenedentes bacterium]|nr:glycosyltransferase family 9 protein [Candidatus Hydrogenedentota bacterium]
MQPRPASPIHVERSSRALRTLVVHTGGIGDFLLFCPCLLRLREEGPILLAGNRSRLNLAIVTGIAQEAFDLDDIGFDSVFSEPSAKLRSVLSRVERAIIWMKDDGTIRDAFHACGVKDVRTFPGLPPEGWVRHASEYYSECLGLECLPPLRLPIEAGDTPHDVLIHPGSGGARKNWPLEHFAAVAERLTQAGRQVEWCAGPAEEGLRLPPDARLVETPAVMSLARELAGTTDYLGNDSGATHLAAACGCRTVAVFGPTDPRVWAPRGDNVTVLAGAPWPEVDEVVAALLRPGEPPPPPDANTPPIP